MQQEQLTVIPAKCVRCGSLFDLKYDLDGQGDGLGSERGSKVAARRTRLCWNCRA